MLQLTFASFQCFATMLFRYHVIAVLHQSTNGNLTSSPIIKTDVMALQSIAIPQCRSCTNRYAIVMSWQRFEQLSTKCIHPRRLCAENLIPNGIMVKLPCY